MHPGNEERNEHGIPLRPLGQTGLKVTIIGIGGGHICRPHNSQADTIGIVQAAVDAGISFIDNAWEYWDGESEKRFGKALQKRRDKVVLMTKVCARDRKTADEQLHDSLRRLQTDCIDVWQFHEMNYDNDPEWLFAAEGAMEAAVAAKKAGKVRCIGFTGHKSPHIMLKMLEQDFEWNTCQLPINAADAHYRSFQNEVLPELNRRGIAAIGMKSLGGDAQLISDAGLTPQQCRRYALSQPISTLVCGIETMENLEQDLEIARNFTPMTNEEQSDVLEQIRTGATDGRYEWFKSTQYYDSQYHRQQHGFPPIQTVRGD